jgi:PIN domain nuclease of toxin-antitoxin system
VRVLLDTNVFLWCLAGETRRLSARAAAVLEDESTVLLLSAASLWEIALKVRAGKLDLPERWQFFYEHMSALGIQVVLPVESRHVFGLFALPDHHRDPFDRLLVAQCQAERLPLVASDQILRRYDIQILW